MEAIETSDSSQCCSRRRDEEVMEFSTVFHNSVTDLEISDNNLLPLPTISLTEGLCYPCTIIRLTTLLQLSL